MLLRFVASNFLSIADEIDFNMFPAPKLKTHKSHVYKTKQVDVLKAAAIYGANGSGKSNLVLAMEYLHNVVIKGDIFDYGNAYHRLVKDAEKEPISFEIEFKKYDKHFSYGIAIKNYQIVEEWLHEIKDFKKNKSIIIFERSIEDKAIPLTMNKHYVQTEKEQIRLEIYVKEILDSTTPFIFLIYKKGFQILDIAHEWFKTDFQIMMPSTNYLILNRSLVDKNFLSFVNRIFPKLDTGVDEIHIEEVPLNQYVDKNELEDLKRNILKKMKTNETKVINLGKSNDRIAVKNEDNSLSIHILKTIHTDENGNKILFDLNQESDGTIRMLDLIPIIEILENKEFTIVIDEVGRSIHPTMLKDLLKLLLELNTKGQIIFTTHESQLLDLDIFRSDEIWFTEKDKFGKTSIYPLSDYKPRYDANIQKGYLAGRFGAIPFLGNLKQLKLEESHAEEK